MGLGAQYAELFTTSLQVNDRLHFEYILSSLSTDGFLRIIQKMRFHLVNRKTNGTIR
jgi:hypothetical protein